MKILVTGGTGFVGGALVQRLLRDGHQVSALCHREGPKAEKLRHCGVQVIVGSVTDKETVYRSMKDVEVVFHTAAAFRKITLPSVYWAVNVEGTRNVLDAALSRGVKKFIHCSSCAVHGNVINPPADENAPIRPPQCYQETKYAAEQVVQEVSSKGLQTVIIRPMGVYGPGDVGRFFMIFERVKRGNFPMFGNGKTLYHPLFIDNLMDAFVLAMEKAKGDCPIYLIGDEEYFEIEALVKRVAEVLKLPVKIPHYPLRPLIIASHICVRFCLPFHIKPPLFPSRVDWFRHHRAFIIEKAKRELGYQPRIGFDEGLRRTAAWYREEGLI